MTATTEPSRVTAGDSIFWLKSLSDYPASASWVLAYTFINSAAKISLTATASGADHLVAIAAATSAAWVAGTYTWQATVTKAAERYTVGSGAMVVDPNLAAQTTFDSRTSARKALDAVNLLLETYGSKAYMHSYEINGRKQQFQSPGDFMAFRSILEAEVSKEDNAAKIAAGLSPRNLLFVRFNSR